MRTSAIWALDTRPKTPTWRQHEFRDDLQETVCGIPIAECGLPEDDNEIWYCPKCVRWVLDGYEFRYRLASWEALQRLPAVAGAGAPV